MTDFRHYEAVNAVYASDFQAGLLPCRMTVEVLGLAGFGDVEIDWVVDCGE
ncbi:MAG: RidA family protein [Limnospira sp.]